MENAACQCVGTNITLTAATTVAGATTFCAGGNVVLNGTTGTGVTYAWKRGGTAISGATKNSYTATLAGNYTLTVSNGSCSTTSNALTVTVNTAPTATITPASSTALCTGGSVVLNGATGTGYAYLWKRGGTTISGATASSYTASVAVAIRSQQRARAAPPHRGYYCYSGLRPNGNDHRSQCDHILQRR